MISQDQFVSISDFRWNIKKYAKVIKQHPLYILANNKPIFKVSKIDDTEDFSYTFNPPITVSTLLDELREADDKGIY
jgi:hypothetical protein